MRRSQLDRACDRLEAEIAVKQAEIDTWRRAIDVLRSETGKTVQRMVNGPRKRRGKKGNENAYPVSRIPYADDVDPDRG